MGTITFTVTETSKPDATKTYNVADADIDRMVAAYQQDANTDINGTATRSQVLLYIAKTWLKDAQQKVSSKEYAAAQAAVQPVPSFPAS